VDVQLRAIAEPNRREILRLVWSRERAAGDIARHFDITRPAVSQHLRVLREAGLLSERRDGTRRFYRALPETLGELRAVLEAYWEDTLVTLKTAAERAEQSERKRGKRERRHQGH
jgi:DNA-binding transcriptional ArsR family regulator